MQINKKQLVDEFNCIIKNGKNPNYLGIIVLALSGMVLLMFVARFWWLILIVGGLYYYLKYYRKEKDGKGKNKKKR